MKPRKKGWLYNNRRYIGIVLIVVMLMGLYVDARQAALRKDDQIGALVDHAKEVEQNQQTFRTEANKKITDLTTGIYILSEQLRALQVEPAVNPDGTPRATTTTTPRSTTPTTTQPPRTTTTTQPPRTTTPPSTSPPPAPPVTTPPSTPPTPPSTITPPPPVPPVTIPPVVPPVVNQTLCSLIPCSSSGSVEYFMWRFL